MTIIKSQKDEIANLENKNNNLKETMAQIGTREYLEKIAREQFNLRAPGEQVVVIAKDKTDRQILFASADGSAKKNVLQNMIFRLKEFISSFYQP